ncbi:MAG: hypothetical protein AAFZ04_02775 [Pseudomonadota bacterium]
MTKVNFLTAAGLVAIPAIAMATPTLAQNALSFSGTATFGYSTSDGSGIPALNSSLDVYSIDVETDIAYGSNWNLGVDLGFASGDGNVAAAPGGVNPDLLDFEFEPSYRMNNGGYVGVYYQHNALDVSGAGTAAFLAANGLPPNFGQRDTESYGIFGGYEGNLFSIEGFAGISDLNQTFFVPADAHDYGVSAAYKLTPQAEVFGSIIKTDVDLGGGSFGLLSVSGGGEYTFASGFSGYGALTLVEVDTTPIFVGVVDSFGYTLGVAYDLSSRFNIPVSLNAEYTNTETQTSKTPQFFPNDATVEQFSFGVTVALGGAHKKALNSSTRTARGGNRSVVTAIAKSF